MIRIGTSGFSYADWKGPFYPAGLPASGMLPFYAGRFSTLELNFTYYRMPSAATLERMAAKSDGRLIFTVKAHQDITHTRAKDAATVRNFISGLEPLRAGSTLGAVLAQFPWSFAHNSGNLSYLKRLSDDFDELPLVIEFRNAGWIRDEVFDFLRRHRLGFCCVDQPKLKGLVPPVAQATSQIGYVRFHGRNAEHWWRHEEAAQRYDYLYSEAELAEWVPKIKALDKGARTTFVFTNNHFQAKAVKNAMMLAELLDVDLAPAMPSERT